MSYQLIEIVQNLGHPRILVLGDLILDRYIWGDVERVSQEAPVILLQVDKSELRLGGAGNVANMLRGLETEVTLAGVVGADADGALVQDALEKTGTCCAAVITDGARPTTVKERYIGRAQQRHPHQMLRVDREVRDPIDDTIAAKMLNRVLPVIAEHQAVLISDYGKGVCTPAVIERVIEVATAARVPVIVDPRPGDDYSLYGGATAITPNRMETKRATGISICNADDAFAAGAALCDRLALKHAFVTLDSDGIALVTAGGDCELLPTRKREVYDITGAGDMVLATIGIGLADGVDPVQIARLANVTGGLEVEQIGVANVSRDEILADLAAGARNTAEKICDVHQLKLHVAARRKLGHKVVFTNGCFDLLHVGHVQYLQDAAQEGDCLIVALNSDAGVRRLGKGLDRPLFSEQHRATMLAALDAVDYVLLFDELTPHELLHELKPDLLVKGGTYAHDEIVGWEVVEAYGGKVKSLSIVEGVSTTDIITRLRSTSTDGPGISGWERKAG